MEAVICVWLNDDEPTIGLNDILNIPPFSSKFGSEPELTSLP